MRRPGKIATLSMPIIALIIALTTLAFSYVPRAYAAEYNLTDLPEYVADYFGITEFEAGLLVSFVILLFPIVMVAFTMKKQANQAITYSCLIVGFATMGFLVAMSWLPFWIFLVVSLIVALMFAGQVRDLITGTNR